MKSLFNTNKFSWITRNKSLAIALTLGIAVGVAFDRVPSLASGITSVNVPIKTKRDAEGPVDVHQQLEAMQKQLDDLKSLSNPWSFPISGFDTWMPSLDDSVFRQLRSPGITTSESNDSVKVTADLPGVDEKDIEVLVSDRSITIKGQRDHEKFTRRVYLSVPVNSEQGKATLSKGVLTVELPKGSKVADSGHKLPVRTE